MIVEKDVFAKMRDGVRLAVDIYRPDAPGRFPALLAMSPYTKEIQSLVETLPRGLGMNAEFAMVEAGDSEYLVRSGYVHVIADVRGTGKSEGEYFNWISEKEQEDGYDLVEWIAQQPWCDGNIGMIGISYYAFIQYLVAAQQPPHLKAIFPLDGWGDTYRDIAYHGGIPSVFPCILHRVIFANKSVCISKLIYSEEDLKGRVEELRKDAGTNYNNSPYIVGVLASPDAFPSAFDFLVNRLDGPFYWERSPAVKMDRIKAATYLATELHGYPVCMHQPGATTWGWEKIQAPKKLTLLSDGGPGGPEERPFHKFHDEIVRWFDYWLKGTDNGIMKEPPVKIWVRGAERWRYEHEWPLVEKTRWAKYYLKAGKLLQDEIAPRTNESPDILQYKPVLPTIYGSFPLSPKPDHLTFVSESLEKDIEIIGPICLYLYATLTSEDGDFIVVLKDLSPDGSVFTLTRGWLKASHRETDGERSRPWRPYHSHTNPIPVVPGKVYEYAIEIQSIANLFKSGHKIQLEIWPCDWYGPGEPYDWTLMWGLVQHIPYGKEVTYEIHHTPQYPSYLLLPIIIEA